MARRPGHDDDWTPDEADWRPRDWSPEFDDEDDELEDAEDPRAAGPGEHDAALLRDDEPRLVTCPSCHKKVWEEAERCHRCGHLFNGSAAESGLEARRRRWWITLIAVVTLLAFLLAVGLLACLWH